MKRMVIVLLVCIAVFFVLRTALGALMSSLPPSREEIETVTDLSFHHIESVTSCGTGETYEAWQIELALNEQGTLVSPIYLVKERDGTLTLSGGYCKSPFWWTFLVRSQQTVTLLLYLALGGLVVGMPLVGIRSLLRSMSGNRLAQQLETTSSIDRLLRAADSTDERVQSTVASVLERLNTPESVEALLTIVEKHRQARTYAAASLARLYRSESISDQHKQQILKWRSKIEFLLEGESLDP